MLNLTRRHPPAEINLRGDGILPTTVEDLADLVAAATDLNRVDELARIRRQRERITFGDIADAVAESVDGPAVPRRGIEIIA